MNSKPEIKFTKLFINNEFVDAISGKTFSTIDPSDETEIAQIAEGDKADIDEAVRAAREAFEIGIKTCVCGVSGLIAVYRVNMEDYGRQWERKTDVEACGLDAEGQGLPGPPRHCRQWEVPLLRPGRRGAVH